ncbi:MAG: hypothetical protein K8M05_33485 [Deltaproteobacteria bacterium]|nr:hypothetical protein [Kofleriaceae bacterium]
MSEPATVATPVTPVTPVHDALLDEPTTRQLFFDIEEAAELVDVVTKGPGARRADPVAAAMPSLADAQRALASGHAVQLRYRFGGEEWWDTLVRTSAGVRLIRISHTRALAAPDRP